MASAARQHIISALHRLWGSPVKGAQQSPRSRNLFLAVASAGIVTAATTVAATAAASQVDVQDFPVDKLACQRSSKPPRIPVILVACGSFNPPTYMHLRMFELAKQELTKRGYDVWGGYMSPVSDAYAKPNLVAADHRVTMCRLAAQTSDVVMVDAWEASRPGYTRSLEVLGHVRNEVQRFLRQADDDEKCYRTPKVMLLCGGDMLTSMVIPGVWEDPEAILRDHGAVVVDRPGAAARKLLETPGNVLHQHRDSILLVEDPVVGSVAVGGSIKYLGTDAVVKYIGQQGLYRQ